MQGSGRLPGLGSSLDSDAALASPRLEGLPPASFLTKTLQRCSPREAGLRKLPQYRNLEILHSLLRYKAILLHFGKIYVIQLDL